ncbi:adenine nucleotide alpha hydrolases-like protein [Ceratobasidium sp. AG-I]|nr:adenine nucleotide alpha hydrolases-like protein [Ceratobasidium sp. AG-I]
MSVITATEFARFLASSKPPTGWGRSMIIALSGGPDSLCLLFLLHKHFASQPLSSTRPSLRSLTIDHSLQPTSRASALRTHIRSISLGVPNTILPAEWGSNAHPPRGGPIEEAARDARYRALWRGIRAETATSYQPVDRERQIPSEPIGTAIQAEMRIGADKKEECATIMFAHHADDQLETVVMRAMRGTGAYGMGGVRAVRRWGMGVGEADAVLGGMKTWVCRPLLSMSKERILATCHANGLEYEQDVTNFMPDLTVRNAVRYALFTSAQNTCPDPPTITISNSPAFQPTPTPQTSQPASSCFDLNTKAKIAASCLPDIHHAIQHVYSLATGCPTPLHLPTSLPDLECMRAYVQRMAVRVRETDDAVTSYLSTHTRPSPPSTLLIIPSDLPADAQTQSALVHRILRCVSPHPWGSPESEAGRRRTSIQQILQRVWGITHDSDANANANANANVGLRAFAAGAQVLWTPVRLLPNGSFRFLPPLPPNDARCPPSPDSLNCPAWLVSRQPLSAQALHTLVISVDPGANARASGSLSVLWDNRFIVRLRREELERGRLVIRPKGRLVLPEVVRVREDSEESVKCEMEFIRELGAV